MNRHLKLHWLGILCVLSFSASSAKPQSTELLWKKDFGKEVSWYVRTSPGILLVKSGKSLTALDGADGRQLWTLPDVEPGGLALRSISGQFLRGKNVLEVPGMGVLLLNRIKFPGNTDERLVALNLMTGERLWDLAEVDDLLAVVQLAGTNEIILASARLQKKVMTGELVATAVTPLAAYVVPYPYRVEFQRLNALTGKVLWNAEFPRLFTPGAQSFSALGDYLYLYNSNSHLGSVALANGDRAWDDGAKQFGSYPLPLPLGMSNGRLIYGLKTVQAVDPVSGKMTWEIDDLGKIAGILAQDDVVVAIGDKSIAAADAKSGAERWRKSTHGHATNMVSEKASDAILYVDGKGLHRVERTTGKSLLDAPLQDGSHPYVIRFAGPKALVTIAKNDTCAYGLTTGAKLFCAGKLVGFFPSIALQDHWPMVADDGENITTENRSSAASGQSQLISDSTLLSGAFLKYLQDAAAADNGVMDAYETENEKGDRTVWWIDPATSRKIVFSLSGTQRDASLPMSVIFGVQGNEIWGASYAEK